MCSVQSWCRERENRCVRKCPSVSEDTLGHLDIPAHLVCPKVCPVCPSVSGQCPASVRGHMSEVSEVSEDICPNVRKCPSRAQSLRPNTSRRVLFWAVGPPAILRRVARRRVTAETTSHPSDMGRLGSQRTHPTVWDRSEISCLSVPEAQTPFDFLVAFIAMSVLDARTRSLQIAICLRNHVYRRLISDEPHHSAVRPMICRLLWSSAPLGSG